MRKKLLNNSYPAMDFLAQTAELLAPERQAWNEGFLFVAGVDEAGRGCCAGPVCAAAVIFLDHARIPAGVFDSKQLTPKRRMELREILLTDPSVCSARAMVMHDEIDRINILQATWKAMRMALEALPQEPGLALIDGNPVKGLPFPSRSIVKGDAKSASIAAASILAKTERDLYMEQADILYPQYSFAVHKGYCTALHTKLIRQFGPSPIHRLTFEPVKSILDPPPQQPDLF